LAAMVIGWSGPGSFMLFRPLVSRFVIADGDPRGFVMNGSGV
jgi:hypothetical protein